MQEIISFLLFFLGMIMLFYIKKTIFYFLFKVNTFFEKKFKRTLGYKGKCLNIAVAIGMTLLFYIPALSSMIVSLYFIDNTGLSNISNIHFIIAIIDLLSASVAIRIAKKKAGDTASEFY